MFRGLYNVILNLFQNLAQDIQRTKSEESQSRSTLFPCERALTSPHPSLPPLRFASGNRKLRLRYFLVPSREELMVQGDNSSHLSKSLTKAKAAFTLAEVLITLGIIGVVAAMTMPVLITNQKAHKLKSQYLKAYSEISQALKMMKYDEISLDPKSYAGANKQGKFIDVFSSYFKVAHLCGDNAGINAKRNKDLCFYSGDTSYMTLDGKAKPSWALFDDGQFVLLDGALIMLENPYSSANAPIFIHVDINGKNAKPNRLGFDVFTFVITDSEEMVPMGHNGTTYSNPASYCNPKVSNPYNGFACAYEAMNRTEYFKTVVKNIK